MSKQRSRFLSMIGLFWMIVLLCGALPSTALAADDHDDDAARLVGTWRLTVQFPGNPNEFFSLMVVNPGGSMTDRFGDSPRTSVSSGVWKKVRGHGMFAITFEGFVDTDSDGAFDFRYRIRATMHVADDGTLTGTGTSDPLTLDGTTLLAPPSAGIRVKGTRLRVMRE